jgi:hypothetical protein
MASESLAAIGAAGFHGAVGMEDDLPAPAMDARFVVEFAEKPAVIDRRLAAVALVPDVVHVRG